MEKAIGRYLTVRQAAEHLGLSVFSIYRLVENRVVPFIPMHPSHRGPTLGRPSLRFDIRALDAWMEKQVVKPAAQFVKEKLGNSV